jgi:hypothetical protein
MDLMETEMETSCFSPVSSAILAVIETGFRTMTGFHYRKLVFKFHF